MKRLDPKFLTRLSRSYSLKKNETDFLADALGLLSPKRNTKAYTNYKPLIFTNLQRGSVTEQYREIEDELLHQYKLPVVDHAKQMNSLLLDLQAASDIPTKRHLQKNLLNHVRSLQSEEELLELARLSFYQNRLTIPLMTRFILNKNLRLLSRLPFDVENLDKVEFSKNGWTELNFSEFKVLLMKKYHDLNKPLSIVRILKDNFDGELLPLLKKEKLTPFYERILWKFYFDYVQKNQEKTVIQALDSIRSSFLIWEGSSTNCCEIAGSILRQHELTMLQRIFLELSSCNAVEKITTAELTEGRSALLSALKKVSVKYKLYAVTDSVSQSVSDRAFMYSLIHSIENIIWSHLHDWRNDEVLVRLVSDLNKYRTQITHDSVLEPTGTEAYTY